MVACIGTVSYVYGYDTILEAAALLAGDAMIHLLIVGDGSQKAAVRETVAARGLTNVTLLPAQPHARIRGLLAAADLSVGALLPMPVTRGQLPVRILEAMAMARPVVFSGEGVASRLVAESGAGVTVPAGDAPALADAIAALAADPACRAAAGRGRPRDDPGALQPRHRRREDRGIAAARVQPVACWPRSHPTGRDRRRLQFGVGAARIVLPSTDLEVGHADRDP